ncbi:hypothetical protein HYW75_01815 [Candidatus Pacearchaeota archaeon]|nr:hypothetical protein [Candidatus Pacearchaeota archaeon]
MDEDSIVVSRRVVGKPFYHNNLATALENCQKEHEALFMPALVDTRISSPKNALIWQNWYCSPSIRATGRTSQGNPVVVIAHIPNYFSKPKNIRTAIKYGLKDGAGILPQKEFQRLVDLDESVNCFGDRLVWLLDEDKFRNSFSGVVQIDKALEHPQTIPFLGGRERAEAYMKRHEEVYGDKIGIWKKNDLYDDVSVGRLLFFGSSGSGSLRGDCGALRCDGRFVGVRRSAEGTSPNFSK